MYDPHDRDKLMALAERVEAAEGPSYALDCEIWDATYPGERQARFDKMCSEGPYRGRLGPADMDGYVQPLRAFTASIDAAMTLVPEGWGFKAEHNMGHGTTFTVGHVGANKMYDRPEGWAKAATPALALAAAALRAKAGQG
jgi:hypothetical protein